MEHKMRDLSAEERQKYIDAISTHMRSIAEECDESLQYEYDVLKLALVTLTAQPVRRPKNIGPGYASVALSTRDEQWYDAIAEAGYEVQE